MSQFSKATLHKLNSHLGKLKEASTYYKENYQLSKEKNLNHSKVLIRNKNLAKALLIELMFLNIEALKIDSPKTSFINQVLLKNKKIFINNKLYNESYLSDENTSSTQLKSRKKKIYSEITRFKLIIKNNLNLFKQNTNNLLNDDSQLLLLKKLIFFSNQKLENFYNFIRKEGFGKWYIYFSRFIIISLLHFIPFIQLSTTLFFNQPNKQITHPITSYLFNFVPFLVPIINITMPVLNQDTISFLLLVPYLYFFIYSFKKYKISRKIAYQGSFALALMLFRYSLILSQEAITVLYKFTKRFFFLKKFQHIDLLRDDINFYVEDLEEMRNYREEFFQLGESIFSLDDLTRITKLWESTTIFSLLGVIALLYNYMYFIVRGQKPIIPVVTRTVQRMMIDRNGRES